MGKYNFKCACEPCRERWPLLTHLPQKLSGDACHEKLSAAEAKTQGCYIFSIVVSFTAAMGLFCYAFAQLGVTNVIPVASTG